MLTPVFEEGMEHLMAAASEATLACMCAESLWWQCHRRLLADALVARGHEVDHILPDGRLEPHALMPAAVVSGDRVTYPPPQQSLGI
jgi:uncharacterized protein (DUF488 family)